MNRKIKKNLSIALITAGIFSGVSYCEEVGQSKYMHTPQEYFQDIDTMVETMEEVHPNLYHSITEKEFDKEILKIKKSITSPISDYEFSKKMNPLISKLKDGHTWLNISTYIAEGYYRNDKPVFPFDIDIVENRFFVRKSYQSENDIDDKTEIISIDGRKADEIIADFLDSYSGELDSFEKSMLESQFPMWYANMYDFKDTYDIEYKEKGQKKVEKSIVKGTKYSKIRLSESLNVVSNELYTYKYMEDVSAAYIKLDGFNMFEEYKGFLENSFKDMKDKNAQNLIIDIRDNTGGNMTLGTYLLSHLTSKPFRVVGSDIQNISPKAIEAIKNNFDNWGHTTTYLEDGNLLEIKSAYSEPFYIRKGRHESNDIAESRRYEPEEIFDGDIYVLIGPKTYSSGVMFAAVIKDYKLGTIIGEETGGVAGGYTNTTKFYLPNSNISYSVSHEYFTRPSDEPCKSGVKADYPVLETVESYMSDSDKVLEKTKEIINKNRKQLKK